LEHFTVHVLAGAEISLRGHTDIGFASASQSRPRDHGRCLHEPLCVPARYPPPDRPAAPQFPTSTRLFRCAVVLALVRRGTARSLPGEPDTGCESHFRSSEGVASGRKPAGSTRTKAMALEPSSGLILMIRLAPGLQAWARLEPHQFRDRARCRR
jgi:hypothetical protein